MKSPAARNGELPTRVGPTHRRAVYGVPNRRRWHTPTMVSNLCLRAALKSPAARKRIKLIAVNTATAPLSTRAAPERGTSEASRASCSRLPSEGGSCSHCFGPGSGGSGRSHRACWSAAFFLPQRRGQGGGVDAKAEKSILSPRGRCPAFSPRRDKMDFRCRSRRTTLRPELTMALAADRPA